MIEPPIPATSSIEEPRPKKGAFIGCLIVTIVALLAGNGALRFFVYDHNSKFLQPKAAMKGLEIAIKGYKTEYGNLPFVGTNPTQDNQPFDTTDANGKALLDILLAKD